MLKWNVGANGTLCQSSLETRNHLYFDCKFSEEIWRPLTQNLPSQRYTFHWDSLMELLVDDSQEKLTLFLKRYTFQATLHVIWREQN